MSKKFAVIIGSTRPTRIGHDIADWFVRTVADTPDAQFETIDLREVNLPFMDEPNTPSLGQYQKDYTNKWKALVDSYDGFVFVTAEYNAGYPAPLKNAIDYLSAEWHDKPAAIVSYGWGGGVGAAAQLRQVLERLKMRPTGTSPALTFGADTFNESAQLQDVDKSFAVNVDEAKLAAKQLVDLTTS
jgi:NAD(P)H-dependent FMN reductase